MKMYLVTLCIFDDLYVSGDKNLASLKITAIIMIFGFLLGVRIKTDYQGSVIVKFL